MKKVKEEESESMKDIIVDYPLRDEIVQQRALNVKHSERNNLPISWSVKSDPEVRIVHRSKNAVNSIFRPPWTTLSYFCIFYDRKKSDKKYT